MKTDLVPVQVSEGCSDGESVVIRTSHGSNAALELEQGIAKLWNSFQALDSRVHVAGVALKIVF